MSPSAFLTKFSPEIRVLIYGHVFGLSETITPSTKSMPAPTGDHKLQLKAALATTYTPVETSILAANKLIFNEASYVLYDNKTVRGNIAELASLLRSATFTTLVQHVEVEDAANGYKDAAFIHTLLRIQQLFRIRSTVILSDGFGLAEGDGMSFLPVPKFATMAKLGKATCVEIGRFQLKGKFKDIEIVNRKLLKMWPGVVNAPKDFDAYLEVLVLYIKNNIPPRMWNATVWASQTSLRRWVGLYDEVFNTTDHAAQNWDEQKTEILKAFSDSVRGWMPKSYLDVRLENQSLRSLKPGDNEELLAWATDLLSINIAAYYADTGRDDDGGVELRAAHWVETDGGLHTFRIMASHLMATRMGRTNAHYIRHPLRECCIRTAEVRETIERYPPRMLQKSVEDLTPDELRQLFFLDVATRAPRTFFDDKYEQDLEVWSGLHLRRYLRATGLMKESIIQRATTRDMRQAMGYTIGLFAQPHIAARELALGKARRNDEPNHEIDAHLYRPLAWEYGSLFADLVTSMSQPAEEMVRLVTGCHATNRTTGDDELPELLNTHDTTGEDGDGDSGGDLPELL